MASLLITDALHGRADALALKMDRSLLAYKKYHDWSFRAIVFLTSWTVALLTVFEEPSWQTSSEALLPLYATIPVEILCILVFMADCYYQYVWLGGTRERWWNHEYAVYKALAVLLMVLDVLATLSPIQFPRFSRFLRPLFGLSRMRHVRSALSGIFRSLPAIAVILCLMVFYVSVNGIVAWLLFDPRLVPWKNIVSPENHTTGICSTFDGKCNQYFGTISDALYQSAILLTGVNFPDIMLPYFKVGAWSAWFFTCHILFGFYFLNRLLVAAAFDRYKRDTHARVKQTVENRVMSFHHAFGLLCDDNGKLHIDQWIEVAQATRPSITTESARIMFYCVDSMYSGEIDAESFEDLCQFLDVRIERNTAQQSELQFTVSSLVKRPHFQILFDFLVVVSVVRLIFLRTGTNPDTDASGHESSDASVDSISYVLAGCFVVEIMIKTFALGWRTYWSDFFNRIDFIVAWPSVIGTLALDVLHHYSSTFSRSGDFLSILFIIRLARIFRVFRVVRFLRHPVTWNVLTSFSKTLPIFLRFLVILLSIIFSFAAIGMESFATCLDVNDRNVAKTSYAAQGLGELNFKNFGSSFATTFVMLMARKFPALMEGTAAGCGWGAFVYYFSFYILVVQVFTSVFVAFVIEAYRNIQQSDRVDMRQEKHPMEEMIYERVMESIAYVTKSTSRAELVETWRVDKKIRFVDLVGWTTKRKRGVSHDVHMDSVDRENQELKDALRQLDPNHPLLAKRASVKPSWSSRGRNSMVDEDSLANEVGDSSSVLLLEKMEGAKNSDV